jgi:hypothetical protein
MPNTLLLSAQTSSGLLQWHEVLETSKLILRYLCHNNFILNAIQPNKPIWLICHNPNKHININKYIVINVLCKQHNKILVTVITNITTHHFQPLKHLKLLTISLPRINSVVLLWQECATLLTQYNYKVFSEIMPLNADMEYRIAHELGFLHTMFKYHTNTPLKYLQENNVMVGPVWFN